MSVQWCNRDDKETSMGKCFRCKDMDDDGHCDYASSISEEEYFDRIGLTDPIDKICNERD